MDFVNKKLDEFENYIRGKRVAIIGLGVSNLPLLEYMYDKKANVTIFDEKNEEKANQEALTKVKEYRFKTFFGKNSLTNLKGFDIIFRSPSCLPNKPELVAESERGALVTTEIEMCIELCPCKVIGVTGSDGKTTTTTLISEILKEAGYNVFLGGNIGTPLFTFVLWNSMDTDPF